MIASFVNVEKENAQGQLMTVGAFVGLRRFQIIEPIASPKALVVVRSDYFCAGEEWKDVSGSAAMVKLLGNLAVREMNGFPKTRKGTWQINRLAR
ncbi:MAG TPA: hypothetical protein PK580_10055 [Nitrosomonas halophila]|nr:hypothetical protein [Nitrosomonas halophila]